MKARLSLVIALALPRLLSAQGFPPTPPAPGPISPAQFPPFQETVLPNGMRVVLVHSDRQPVVSLTLAFPAGRIYDPAGKEGLADMVAGLLTKGSDKATADQIAASIEGVGGSLSASADYDFLTVSADVLSGDARLAFRLLADAAARPAFPVSELELLRTQTLSALQLELSQPAALAKRFSLLELYGRNPYARSPLPTTIKAITRADLVAFHRARIRPSGALLVVAGALSLDDVKRLAAEVFPASWTGQPVAARPFPTPPVRTRPSIVLVHRPGSVQSTITVSNLTFLPTTPLWYGATVANRILGGGSDSRLFLILREQKSWTYGAYSDLARRKGIGYFGATAEVRTEVTDSALSEMLSQIRRLDVEQVSPAELDAAKGALVGRFPLTIETAGQVASAVANAKLLGLPADYVRTYRQKLAAVSAAEVQTAARAAMKPQASVIVVVGDATKLFSTLSPFGTVKVVSAEGKPLAQSDLQPRVAALDVDLSKLVTRRDSFVVVFQGKPVGYQIVSLAKTGEGYTYSEDANLAGFAQQKSTLLLDPQARPISVSQSGKMQGQEVSLAVSFANGRAKGSGKTPSPQGVKPVEYDVAFPPGTLDDNSFFAIFPGLSWGATTRMSLNVLDSGKGEIVPRLVAVSGSDRVTVPAGTFETWKVEMTGGEEPLTLYVTKGSPTRVVKFVPSGAPIEFLLAQ